VVLLIVNDRIRGKTPRFARHFDSFSPLGYLGGASRSTFVGRSAPLAKIDGRKATAVLLTQLPQPWEDMLLQRVALFDKVGEGGAHEDAEGFGRLRHV
jgi:hypothetical protein